MRIKATFIGLIVAAITVIVVQQQSLDRLRREITGLREHSAETVSNQQKVIPKPQSEAVLSTEQTASPQAIGWQTVEADDYGTYIANLQAIGCPEQTIRDIIIADLDRNYASRIAELILNRKKQSPYWRVSDFDLLVNHEREIKRVENEKRAAARELLGIDLDEEIRLRKTLVNESEADLDFVAPERRGSVAELLRGYDLRWSEIMIKRDSGLLSQEQVQPQLVQLEQSRQADVASLLGPQELEDFLMRQSEVSNRLRKQLEAFEPSEEEFRRVFRLEKQFSSEHPIGEPIPPGAQTKHDEALRVALGEQRYGEYKKAISADYWNLYKITKEYNLPRQVADTVFQMQPEAEAQASQIRSNPSLSPDAKAAALKGIRETTEASMTTYLGEEGFRRYHARAQFWLHQISP